MEDLEKQVRRARRRLALQRFVGILGWCWFAALVAALAARRADGSAARDRRLGVGGRELGAGLFAAAIWTAIVGPSRSTRRWKSTAGSVSRNGFPARWR